MNDDDSNSAMPVKRRQKVHRQRSSNNLALACVLAFVLMMSSVTVVLPTAAGQQPPAGTSEQQGRQTQDVVSDAASPVVDDSSKALTKEEGDHDKKFEIVEATIPGIHNAIKAGEITCTELVQQYIDRAKAYNGVCTQLVTEDGEAVPAATGRVIAGSPLEYPTETVAASEILPDLDQYAGLPMEFGGMEPTASDPTVQQQYGMVAGIPNAGQINALETLNIRGERSVTCKGAFDAHPSTGPLPEGAPEVCEEFRQQPDALERAAELDAQYGSNPPLDELPMYCIPFAMKDWFDTKDMRSTGGLDTNFAMDVPPVDSTLVDQLRGKGAIIYANAVADQVGGGRAGPIEPTSAYYGSVTRSTWGGVSCNPYDTERDPGNSSSGSGASVAANLAVCSTCEQTGSSCRTPGARSGVVSLVTTKALISYGGTSSNGYVERAGILCRTVGDTALVLDALKDPKRGYFDPRDEYTAVPKALIPEEPYATFVVDEKDIKDKKPLEGMRIGIVREYTPKEVPNQVAISDQIDNEYKTVLRDELGAELVESVDPLYPDDPAIQNMEYTFQDGLAEILSMNMPEYFFQTTSSGELEFAVPGYNVTTRDYLVDLARGEAPLSDNLNLRRAISSLERPGTGIFSMAKYLLDRGDERVNDWASLVNNTKYFKQDNSSRGRIGALNAVGVQDLRADEGIESIKMREALRLVVLNVMYENDIDVLVHPENTIPRYKIGGPDEPAESSISPTPLLGVPAITVPAGFNQISYEPQFALSEDKTEYIEISGTEQSLLPHPMPIAIKFWAGPGEEPVLFKVASTYEAATHHRTPPPDFGPLSNDNSFPIEHLSNTTASAGYGVYAQKPARAEYVTEESELVGDKIDSITLRMKSVGTINGTAEIGVLNEDLSVKKLFGTLDVTTLTPTYTDYEFALTGDELYQIESGDRIGIKYEGGGFDETSWVSVMLDLDAVDPFDGANSYLQYHHQGSWQQSPDRDMYMELKQTNG